MVLNMILIGVVALVIVVWILLEVKRVKHKIFSVFILGLIVFIYFSFVFVLRGKSLDLTSFEGIRQAGALYFSWWGLVFVNLKTVTANAIHLNWVSDNVTKVINSTVNKVYIPS